MTEPHPVSDHGDDPPRPVFVSYATADRKQALRVCEAIERRGRCCWISTRDVAPGENYQEAIVRAIRDAGAMVLVFSRAANDSDEIKKELSLASRYRIPVLTLRIEDVEPSDAFAYELSTRQWIDAFAGWDRSLDLLADRIGQYPVDAPPRTTPPPPRPAASPRRLPLIAAACVALLLAGVGGWWFLHRPAAAAQHSMTVRLAGFQLLSPDLPANLRQTTDAEITAAFNADGVVGVSNASAAPPGDAPAYALGGTIQRDGPSIRVITRMINERSGTTVWTDSFDYQGTEAARVPRHIAVDAGNVVRCGLFGASTYVKPLPDAVLRDYLQFCQGFWNPDMSEGRKALIPIQRVIAAVPDFSWGWAGVAGTYWKIAMTADTPILADEARASGREAADRAVAIDPRNSEALYIKSMLVPRRDWIGRERLLQRAVAARRLDCGCEHHQYGWMLANVGRIGEALEQLRQADDMLALYVYTPLSLAEALVSAGKYDEARQYYDAAAALAPNEDFAAYIRSDAAMKTGNLPALRDPKLKLSAGKRAALTEGFQAAASNDASARQKAARALLALPADEQNDAVALLVGRLGANHEAFELATRIGMRDEYPGPSLFWYRDMRGALNDPGFAAVAGSFGLFDYWRKTRTRPDVCREAAPPPFCRLI